MSTLSYTTAVGALKVIANQQNVEVARDLGCTDEDWELLVNPMPWDGRARRTVKRLLEQIFFGTLEVLALPRIDIPAEYAAACIALFVAPVNYFPACSWIGNFHRADELGNFDGSHNNPIDGLERVSARQLFSLVCQINSGRELKSIANQFKYKTGYSIGALSQEGETDEKKQK